MPDEVTHVSSSWQTSLEVCFGHLIGKSFDDLPIIFGGPGGIPTPISRLNGPALWMLSYGASNLVPRIWYAIWDLNPARRIYKNQQVNPTLMALVNLLSTKKNPKALASGFYGSFC